MLTKDEKLFEKKGLSVLEIWGVQVSEDLGSSELFCSDLFIYILVSTVASSTDCICFWTVGWLCILKDAEGSSWHGLLKGYEAAA